MDLEESQEFELMGERLKVNISAFRLLYIYRLLSQTEMMSINDLNTQLLNHPLIKRTFTTETLNTYLNTLRLFGCRLSRYEEKGQHLYYLEDHPLKLELYEHELRVLTGICEHLALQSATRFSQEFFFIFKRLARIQQTLELNPSIRYERDFQSSIHHALRHQVENFQKYCTEGQVLEVYYEHYDQTPVLKLIEPQEVIYHKKRLYLLGNDPNTNRKVRYEIDRIRSHRQLPSRVRSQTMNTTVTFKLEGRAALNYRPYPGESVQDKGEFLLVKHTTDEVEQLLKRLLKYGTLCQVIAPTSARLEMRELIDQMLNLLNEPTAPVISAIISTAQTDGNLHKWACYLDSLQTWDAEGVD